MTPNNSLIAAILLPVGQLVLIIGGINSSITNQYIMGFPGGSDGQESACSVGDLGSISGSGSSPGLGNGNLVWYSCLGNFRQRSLAGYSPWSHKESDTAEHTQDKRCINTL